MQLPGTERGDQAAIDAIAAGFAPGVLRALKGEGPDLSCEVTVGPGKELDACVDAKGSDARWRTSRCSCESGSWLARTEAAGWS
jgi:hypothetical protein